MFNEKSVVLREICNGVMFMSALIMISVFISYVLNYSRKDPDWYKDTAVQAAGAIVVLMSGHALRAFAGWMQFIWLDIGWDPDVWANALDLFLLATILTILGKMLMVFCFAPLKWRWHITLIAASVAIAIPVGLALMIGGWN